MTAAMPLTLDPATIKAIVGPIPSSPNPQLPRPRRRSVSSASHPGLRRVKRAVLRVAEKARPGL